MARRVAGRVLAERGLEAHPAGNPPGERPKGVHVSVERACGPDRPGRCEEAAPLRAEAAGGGRGRPLVSADSLAATPDGGTLAIPEGALITPLAEEEAERRGIRLARGVQPPQEPRHGAGGIVAVGSDHGGFALKRELLQWARELGWLPQDLGCPDESPVDYPDLAFEVARAVAEGRASLGVVIDGAGIGSAMVANKVPGVRAAMCYDEATARNAREHNHANVLSLGGKMLSREIARTILATFLSTPPGGERHAARVAKIDAVERRFSRS